MGQRASRTQLQLAQGCVSGSGISFLEFSSQQECPEAEDWAAALAFCEIVPQVQEENKRETIKTQQIKAKTLNFRGDRRKIPLP